MLASLIAIRQLDTLPSGKVTLWYLKTQLLRQIFCIKGQKLLLLDIGIINHHLLTRF